MQENIKSKKDLNQNFQRKISGDNNFIKNIKKREKQNKYNYFFVSLLRILKFYAIIKYFSRLFIFRNMFKKKHF